jgi:DNA-binding CsgD family transcriptional regulator
MELADLRAALVDRARGAVLICGPAGVGKTRLANEFLALAKAEGRACGRATASAAAAQFPLGALAHLLPPGVGGKRSDAVALFESVLPAFRGATTDPFVLFADDLHLLDCTSLTLLTQLVGAGAVFLVGTVRTGEPIHEALSALWRGDRALRVDLTELTAAGVEELLSAVLGGPVEARTGADVFAVGRGNPLFVRELILGAVHGGRLIPEHGVWRLTGPLVSTPPLAELVETHLGAVEPAERSILELIAVVGPVGLAELAEIVSMDLLERLERNGLVNVVADGRRHEVILAHPLYAEVLRGQLPLLTRRRLLLEHADRVKRSGARRPGDLLRVATWQLDAVGTADPELLMAATRLARYGHDFTSVRRLATAALAQQHIVECQLLLGEALYELGQFAEAEVVLSEAQAAATDEDDLVAIVATRVRNLTWGLLDPDQALRVSHTARSTIRSRDGTHELLSIEARVQVYSGRPADAMNALAPLMDATAPRTVVLAAVPHAMALVQLGQCERGAAVARQGYLDHARLGEALAMIHPSTHLVIEVHALAEAGRLTEAVERASAGRALAARDRSTIGQIWFAYHLGRCALLAGRPTTACRWFAEAVALCRDNDYLWPCRLVLAGLATAGAMRGDAGSAQRALTEADDLGDIGYLRYEQDLGRAWAAAAGGDVTTARRLLRAAADEASARSCHASEAWLLHDLARLGDPRGVQDRLADLAARGEGQLVIAYAAHASALAADDPGGLCAAADQFEQLGAQLYAAEAAFSAGRAYRRRGQLRDATNADRRAATLASGCEDAKTPGLRNPATTAPLTRRESEVATLAATGATSKQIALTLHLSARTVDNHLQSAFAKLGVTRRTDLAAALASAP